MRLAPAVLYTPARAESRPVGYGLLARPVAFFHAGDHFFAGLVEIMPWPYLVVSPLQK